MTAEHSNNTAPAQHRREAHVLTQCKNMEKPNTKLKASKRKHKTKTPGNKRSLLSRMSPRSLPLLPAAALLSETACRAVCKTSVSRAIRSCFGRRAARTKTAKSCEDGQMGHTASRLQTASCRDPPPLGRGLRTPSPPLAVLADLGSHHPARTPTHTPVHSPSALPPPPLPGSCPFSSPPPLLP